MEKVPCLVIGAGAVGLSVAKALSQAGIETIVLEKHFNFGEENSSRHSEVVHAGMYYPQNSYKAQLCVEGSRLLRSYMCDRSIAHNKCGKLIIAYNDTESSALHKLYHNGLANGVSDLQLLSKEEASRMEPNVKCSEALLSPSTAIFDSHALMLNYVSDVESAGSSVLYNCEVLNVSRGAGSFPTTATSSPPPFVVHTSQGDVACDYLVNAAGLHSQRVASRILPDSYPQGLIPAPYFAKGNYYRLCSAVPTSSGSRPFSRLIYPMPSKGGLGVHATLDLCGGVRFGPDVQWICAPPPPSAELTGRSADEYRFDTARHPPYCDFAVDETRAEAFCAEIRRYYPDIRAENLSPDYAGIRPKLCGPSGAMEKSDDSGGEGGGRFALPASADFCVLGPAQHGVPGLVQLHGIESPGVTASLAVGALVRDILLGNKAPR